MLHSAKVLTKIRSVMPSQELKTVQTSAVAMVTKSPVKGHLSRAVSTGPAWKCINQ